MTLITAPFKPFKEANPTYVAQGFLRQFIAIRKECGWPCFMNSEAEEAETCDEPFVLRDTMIKYYKQGFERAGPYYMQLVADKSNFLALQGVATQMLSAPTLSEVFGTMNVWIPSFDTALSLESYTMKDRFVLRARYDVDDPDHRDISSVVFAANVWKLCNTFHGQIARGHQMSMKIGISAKNWSPTSVLSNSILCPVRLIKDMKEIEVTFDNQYFNRKNDYFDLARWNKHMGNMQKPTGKDIPVGEHYVSLLNTRCLVWDYTRSKPNLASICEGMGLSPKTLRSHLAAAGTTPKEVMHKAESNRIILSVRRGQNLSTVASLYRWANTRDMVAMVKASANIDIKKLKPFAYTKKEFDAY